VKNVVSLWESVVTVDRRNVEEVVAIGGRKEWGDTPDSNIQNRQKYNINYLENNYDC